MNRKQLGSHLESRRSKLVSDRSSLDEYWQELSDVLYSQRSEFTRVHTAGDDLHAHQYNNAPERNRRQLAATIGTMVHPKGRDYFKRTFLNPAHNDSQGVRAWNETADQVMTRAMDHPNSGWWRSTREADNDFVTFGNKVEFITEGQRNRGVKAKCLHLKSVHWACDADNEINEVHQQGELTLYQLESRFGAEALPESFQEKLKTPKSKMSMDPIPVVHCVMERDEYEATSYRFEKNDTVNNDHNWISVWHCDKGHALKIGGFYENPFCIARWATIGKPYGYSPAATIALPASRELNVMSMLYREGMEKLIDPPMLSHGDAGISEYNLHAGGLTVIENNWGDRKSQPIAPLGGVGNVSAAYQAIQAAQEELGGDFFQHILSLPDTRDMTAAEIYERTSQFNRDASPVLEPWESEYNAPRLERVDAILERQGAYGEPPEELVNQGYEFTFDTPLKEARGREKLAKAQQVIEFCGKAAEIDPQKGAEVASEFNWTQMARDVRDEGLSCPAEWAVSEEEAEAASALTQINQMGAEQPELAAQMLAEPDEQLALPAPE